jgi:hypothetical protein
MFIIIIIFIVAIIVFHVNGVQFTICTYEKKKKRNFNRNEWLYEIDNKIVCSRLYTRPTYHFKTL